MASGSSEIVWMNVDEGPVDPTHKSPRPAARGGGIAEALFAHGSARPGGGCARPRRQRPFRQRISSVRRCTYLGFEVPRPHIASSPPGKHQGHHKSYGSLAPHGRGDEGGTDRCNPLHVLQGIRYGGFLS